MVRRASSCLLAVLCLAAIPALPVAASAADYTPIAEYSFDEGEAAGTTFEDLAGENDGTLEGVGRTTKGRYGGALEFHGTEGECASVPDSGSLQLKEEFTIEAWVKSDGLTGEPIVYKETEGYWSYWFGIALGVSGRPEAWITDEEGQEWEVRDPSPVEAGVWTHLAVTYDGAHLRLYVDGVEVASHSAPGAELASEGPLYIGCAPPNHETFEGRIDELRIYDRVLGQADIAADMESPIQTPKAGPVAEYSFDGGEAAGTTLEDLAGEDDGTIEGGAEWASGRYGDSLSFAGKAGECVTVPDSEPLRLGEEATVEAWVKPTGKLTSDPIVFKETGGSFSYTLGLGFTQEGKAEGYLRYGGEEEGVVSPATVEPGVWTHLAITDDGVHLRLYVDGALVATQELPAPGGPLAGEGPLHIGCAPAFGQRFQGRIDEVRLYGRALDGTEVAADMETPIQTPRQGPIAEWSFDEVQTEGGTQTVEDLAGGNEGTLEDGVASARGRYGDSLSFADHEGECVSVPDSATLQLSQEFTVEAWIRTEGSPSTDPIVSKEDGEGGYSYGLGLGVDSSGTLEGFAGGEEVDRYGAIEPGVWTHVAFTYDAAHDRLFVDGAQVASRYVGPGTLASTGPLEIGCAAAFGQTFHGRIDEPRIYERALDGAEVAADMESPIQTPKAGPVAEYSFDEDEGETVEDQAGEDDGTVEGAEWTGHGRYGGAMEFDAAEGDVITVPDSESLRLSEEFTLEAWVRPDEADPWMPVLGKSASGQYGYGLVADADEGPGLHPEGFISHDEFIDSHAFSGTAIPAHAWTHLAVTDDGAHIRLYVDGELVDERASEEVRTGTGPLQIGGDETVAGGGLFDGRIDEVRIYDRGLDAAEVGYDMEAPIQTPKQGPIAAWSFEEGEGSTVEDVTGDEHEGTIEGAEWARGKYGEGLKFDGEDDVVKVPNSPEFALTEGFTLESWVRPESESDEWAPILAKEMGGGEATNELAWWLYEGDSDANEPFGGTEPTLGDQDAAHADDSLPVDVWSHVALTYDGAQVRLYVDGELVDCSPVPAGAPPVTEGELQIGGVAELGSYYKGRIDEVRIFSRALTKAEATDTTSPIFPYGFTVDLVPSGGETTLFFSEATDPLSALSSMPATYYGYRYGVDATPSGPWTMTTATSFVLPTPAEGSTVYVEVFASDAAGNRSVIEAGAAEVAEPKTPEYSEEQLEEADEATEADPNPKSKKLTTKRNSSAVSPMLAPVPDDECVESAPQPHISTHAMQKGYVRINAVGFIRCGFPGVTGFIRNELQYAGPYGIYTVSQSDRVSILSPAPQKKVESIIDPYTCRPGKYFNYVTIYVKAPGDGDIEFREPYSHETSDPRVYESCPKPPELP